MIVKTGLQDATKNVRIYGTISAASSPSAGFLGPLYPRAPRIALPCPFPPLSPRNRPDLLLCLSTAVVSQSARRSYFLSSLPFSSASVVVVLHLHLLLFLLCRPLRPPSSPPLDCPTTCPVGGPTTDGCAQRGDCPHRRGHYFNVTLIKSNNQYLPRKKF